MIYAIFRIQNVYCVTIYLLEIINVVDVRDAHEGTVKLIARARRMYNEQSDKQKPGLSIVGGGRLEITASDVIARDL